MFLLSLKLKRKSNLKSFIIFSISAFFKSSAIVFYFCRFFNNIFQKFCQRLQISKLKCLLEFSKFETLKILAWKETKLSFKFLLAVLLILCQFFLFRYFAKNVNFPNFWIKIFTPIFEIWNFPIFDDFRLISQMTIRFPFKFLEAFFVIFSEISWFNIVFY